MLQLHFVAHRLHGSRGVVQGGGQIGCRRVLSAAGRPANANEAGRLQILKQHVRVDQRVRVPVGHGERDRRQCEVFSDRSADDEILLRPFRALGHTPPPLLSEPCRSSMRVGMPVVIPW